MAYTTLSLAYDACEPMRAELGAAAGDFRTEDEYLAGVVKFLLEVLDDPSGYIESWNLEEVEIGAFAKGVEKTLAHVKVTLATPRLERGKPPFKT